jgi:arylsulfatase A-like enzyme
VFSAFPALHTTSLTVKHTIIILAAMLTASGALDAAAAPSRKPNILHIHADDFRADGLHALGNPVLKTPNLDGLVTSGATFTHCYTQGSMQGAVCLPSRTMMLTGRSWLRLKGATDPATFLPKALAAAGYETWHMGKSGNEFRAGIQAFDTNLIDNARGTGDGPDGRAGSSRRHADAAIRFLSTRQNDRPFYLYLAPPVPHDPRLAEPEFMKMYRAEDIPLPAAFLPLHPWDNGEMTVRDEALAPWPRTPEDTKRQLAEYYACVSGLDHHMGRILAQLEQSGELENTIVVFTGDNGLSIGEHGLFGKQNLYEFGGMHVPLVIAGPGIPKVKIDALVYLMDLLPTFCDLAGATVPAGVEGKSLLPIIQGKAAKVRDVLYTAYRDCQRSVRGERWKLIRYPLVDKTQLFDLGRDPHELTNLAEEPEHAAKVQAMTALLAGEMARYGDTAPLNVANPKPAEWTPPAATAKQASRKANR